MNVPISNSPLIKDLPPSYIEATKDDAFNGFKVGLSSGCKENALILFMGTFLGTFLGTAALTITCLVSEVLTEDGTDNSYINEQRWKIGAAIAIPTGAVVGFVATSMAYYFKAKPKQDHTS